MNRRFGSHCLGSNPSQTHLAEDWRGVQGCGNFTVNEQLVLGIAMPFACRRDSSNLRMHPSREPRT